MSQVTELLFLYDALEAKLTQAESASTQLLAAAVHHLLREYSREDAKGTTMSFQFFAPPRLRVTTDLLSLCDALEARLTQAESAITQLLAAAVHHLLQEDSREDAKTRREQP